MYDPKTDTFVLVGDLVIPRLNFAVSLLEDGTVLVSGGYNPNTINHISSVEIFDPVTETFTLINNMNVARAYHTSTLLENGSVLIAGGWGEDDMDLSGLTSAEIYDPISQTFTIIEEMNVGRKYHSATLLSNGNVLIAGGHEDGWGISSAELFDPTTNSFFLTNDMVDQMINEYGFYKAVLLANGNVLFIGGGENFKATQLAVFIDDNEIPLGTIEINSGALSTTSNNVILSLSTTSISPVNNLRFSDDGITWQDWIPFANTVNYTLPVGDGLKTVYAQFMDSLGKISIPVSNSIELNTFVGTDYSLSINEGALFTNITDVVLSNGAIPFTTSMMISNDGGFSNSQWEPYSAYKDWQIVQYGDYVIPRIVYIKYKDFYGNISPVYQDDIILDFNPPEGSIEVISPESISNIYPKSENSVSSINNSTLKGTYSIYLPFILNIKSNATLILDATDDVSGVKDMLISNYSDFHDANWITYKPLMDWFFPVEANLVFVKFRDFAGNISETYSANK
jgi:hypothetical protein